MSYKTMFDFDDKGNERPCTGCWQCNPSGEQRRRSAIVSSARSRILTACGCSTWSDHEAGACVATAEEKS